MYESTWYESTWYEQPQRTQKGILFAMMRSQNGLSYKAYINIINLEYFADVSYFLHGCLSFDF